MTIVVESDKIAIIVIDSGGGDNRASKISPDIFDHCFWVTKVWLCINVKAMFVIGVTFCLYPLKGWAKNRFHFVQECCAESITEIIVIKVIYMTPEAVITKTAFGDQAVNMRIPFEIPAKGV